MKKMKKLLRFGFFLLLPVIVVSCYPGGAEYYSDTDIVVTDYNDTYDFTQAHTYYMPDTVIYVGKGDKEPDHSFDDLILSTIAGKMLDYGYERITDTVPQPDLLLSVAVATTTNEGIGWIPGYPYYPGWGWGWDWGWWYPGGYYPYYYSFNTGTLAITLGDLSQKKVSADSVSVPAEWNAIINGLLSSSTSDIVKRIKKNINQAFAQSSYLKK